MIARSTLNHTPVFVEYKVLKRCIKGLSRHIRHTYDPDKRERLKIIREEIETLLNQL